MPSPPSAARRREIQLSFEQGAESASRALSGWIERPVRLTVGDVALVDLIDATGILGDPDAPVAACAMGLSNGRLSGQVILVFKDRAGFALVDQLMRQPLGTTTTWGEIERSAAQETTNILGCAFLNALGEHLAADAGPNADGPSADLIPSPPSFFHEFAGSLLQFALADQAMELGQVLVIRSRFAVEPLDSAADLNWTLLFVPSGASLRALAGAFDEPEPIQDDESTRR